MSPEQARAETVDHRSDLFSLGSVMYAMCTGHPPFRADSSYSVLRLITDKEPRPIREINPDIPEWLCTIIGKLMAKQAKDRFASAQEVATLLEDCLAHVQQPTTTSLPAPVAKFVKSLASTSTDNPSAESRGGFRFTPIGKVIAVAAFAFSLIFAGVLVVLEFNKGTLTIECDADDVPIRIMQGDNVVEKMTVSKSPQNVRIAAGNYVVEVDGDFQGVTIKDGKVSLTRRGVATVEISKNATLILASNFEPGNLDGLRFGERHEREEGMEPRGYWNPEVAEPGETREIFASFPTFGDGIEEVGLIVSVEPPHKPTEPSNMQSYLVRASGIRRLKTYSACEASVEGKEFFKPDDTLYTVGYFQLQLDGEEKENVIVDMIVGSAHVNINYVVGLPSELARKILKLNAPNKHSESWLGVSLQRRPQSAWASHLMKLDGWEYDRTRGVPNMIQQQVTLTSGETRTVSIEPADSKVTVAVSDGVLRLSGEKKEVESAVEMIRGIINVAPGKQTEMPGKGYRQPANEPKGNQDSPKAPTSSSESTTINPDIPAEGKPIDKEKLLNELRERDRKFSRRTVELERTWDTLTSPRGEASEERFQSMKYGQPDPGIPDGLPEDYQQPHRIRYIWTGQNFESTLEILVDLETAIHPEHGKLESRSIESDCFSYYRYWNRDLEIFSYNSDIARLSGGKKAWEFLLPGGFGFTPSILSVSNAVEVQDGYILKGVISLPSATIGNRKNCFEIHLDKEMILRKAVIQYHVYDFVIVTSGRSEFDGMPPLAKLGVCRFTMLAKMKNDQAMLETISMK